jgi:hypothetical protein
LGFRRREFVSGEIGDVLRPREIITVRRVVLFLLLRFALVHSAHVLA